MSDERIRLERENCHSNEYDESWRRDSSEETKAKLREFYKKQALETAIDDLYHLYKITYGEEYDQTKGAK